MEESGAFSVLRVLVGLKRIIKEVFEVVFNSIVRRRRMVKSIYNQFNSFSEKLLEMGKVLSNDKILLGKVARNSPL